MLIRKRASGPTVTQDTIAERAYALWQQRGCPEGDGATDWQAAYEQLMAEGARPPRRRPLKGLIARLRSGAA